MLLYKYNFQPNYNILLQTSTQHVVITLSHLCCLSVVSLYPIRTLSLQVDLSDPNNKEEEELGYLKVSLCISSMSPANKALEQQRVLEVADQKSQQQVLTNIISILL